MSACLSASLPVAVFRCFAVTVITLGLCLFSWGVYIHATVANSMFTCDLIIFLSPWFDWSLMKCRSNIKYVLLLYLSEWVTAGQRDRGRDRQREKFTWKLWVRVNSWQSGVFTLSNWVTAQRATATRVQLHITEATRVGQHTGSTTLTRGQFCGTGQLKTCRTHAGSCLKWKASYIVKSGCCVCRWQSHCCRLLCSVLVRLHCQSSRQRFGWYSRTFCS